ncbi:Fc receptor-like protein 6 [Vulpes lagopus]|uniref:Fc receptor-like protein 6 n=1 Tax=Vulpes lagopus TaxID=494514 RepID=UPI001BC9A2B1|nr:Fc receptor-like protein 6 [Vulpes lagopus]
MSFPCARPGSMLLYRIVLFFVPCAGKTVWLHLRAWPDPVFEGDALTLQCQGWRNTEMSQVEFYRDRKALGAPRDVQVLPMGTAALESSGQYSCSGRMAHIPHLGTQRSEMTMVQVQELFRPPELHAVPSPKPREGAPLTLRCQTEMHPQKSASRLLFSFLKNGHTLQDRDPRPELHLPEAREGDSGLYWCQATPKGSRVQKQSPRLEVRVLAPVSQPLLSLSPGPTGLALGDVVQLFCVAINGSPPILYSFYLDGKMLGSPRAPRGRTASFSFTVMSARDTGSYSCQAQNNVSKETSEPKTLSLDTPAGSPAPPGAPRLAPWLCAGLLAVLAVTAALLGCFRPWRQSGPPPTQDPPPAPAGEQHSVFGNVTWQDEDEEADTYPSDLAVLREPEAQPAEPASRTWGTSVIYTEVRCSQLADLPATRPKTRSRTHEAPPGNFEEALYY